MEELDERAFKKVEMYKLVSTLMESSMSVL